MWWMLWKFWDGLRRLVGLVLPIFASAGDYARTAPWVRQTLRFLVLIVILAILAVLQNVIPGLRVSITGHEWLRFSWLPVLFLLLCVAVWLFHWLWLVWMTEEETSDFPDIDEAWTEALQALTAAEIDVQAVPLYLVLGRPAAGEETLFQGAGLPLTVSHAPPRAEAPLHVYGNKHDGIFVTCAGASRLGPQASVLALAAELLPAEAPEALASPAEEDAGDKTIGAGQNRMKGIQRIAKLLEEAQRKGRGPAQMTEVERQHLQLLERAESHEDAARQTARLQHLCRLLAHARRPYCPVNGILVLVPCAALDDDADAETTAAACRHDLTAAWEVFQLHCPLLALVCDLETAPGFAEFLEGYLAHLCRTEEERRRERRRRLGKRFGWGVGLEHPQRTRALEADTRWIGQGMFPFQIYQNLLRPEQAGRESPEEVLRRNSQLYRFLGLMHDGERRLRRIMVQGLECRTDGPALLGGCYLAATGSEPAFVAGVFQRLFEAEASVSWTNQALAEDARYHRMTRYGYALLPLALAAAATVLHFSIWRR